MNWYIIQLNLDVINGSINLDKKDYYKYLFLIAAISNCCSIIIIVLTSLFPSDMAELFGVAVPPSLVWMHFFFIKATVIGIGYFFLSRDITKNHAIAKMGVCEKFMFFTAAVIYFILGAYNIVLFITWFIDLVFGILFVEFLVNYKKI